MKENKNIERLFQEKFKDFEVSPPDFVWENIQEKMNAKKNKRRVIPFWFKASGIAASFVAIVSIIFYNSNGFNSANSIQNNSNSVVNSETNKANTNSDSNFENQKSKTSESNSESNKEQTNSNSSFQNQFENGSKNNSYVNNDATVNNGSKNSNSETNFKSGKGTFKNAKNSNTGLVSNDKKFKNNSKENKSYVSSASGLVSNRNPKNKIYRSEKNKSVISSASGIASNRNNKNKTKNTNSEFDLKLKDFNSSENQSYNSGLTDVNKENSAQINNSNSGVIDINKINSSNIISKNNTGVLVDNGVNAQNGNQTNNATAIISFEEVKVDTITLATVMVEENQLEKLLREKESKKVVDEKEKWSKWAVNSYVSPVFFNSFESGSPISDEFANNEKTFKNSTSYGVGVAYNLNKRLTVKTGVSNLNLDYDTENIAFYSSFEDQSRISNTNIERNANGKFLVLKHEKDQSRNEIENQIIQDNQNLGTLNQKTQYIEVPLELSYAILNKKFGVAIKGGMSTLFLTENAVSIIAGDGNMQIGKASNLNNVHFSSNFGLGLSYNFMKNLQLNVEPTLKYQINTFNKNSDDFSPYVIGVNTGISYKF